MSDLLRRQKCIPCQNGTPPLEKAKITEYIDQIPGWQISEIERDGRKINALTRYYEFRNYRDTMGFLQEVEELAEGEGHHPDFCVQYNKIDFSIWTHAIDGLHKNDFILAAKIDEIMEKRG